MAEQSARPKRISLPDFFGRSVSLPDGPEAWNCRGNGDAVLLLGLGPGLPWQLPFLDGASEVYWLESPRVASAIQASRAQASNAPASKAPACRVQAGLEPCGPLPACWREVTVHEAVAMAAACRCYVYTPGLRLDPQFWGPVLGEVDAAQSAATPQPGRAVGAHRPVLLPGPFCANPEPRA